MQPSTAGSTFVKRDERDVDDRQVGRCTGSIASGQRARVRALEHTARADRCAGPSRARRSRRPPRSPRVAPRCSRQSVNPPVEAPTSSALAARRPASPVRDSAFASLIPPRETNARALRDAHEHSSSTSSPGFSARLSRPNLDLPRHHRRRRRGCARGTGRARSGVCPDVAWPSLRTLSAAAAWRDSAPLRPGRLAKRHPRPSCGMQTSQPRSAHSRRRRQAVIDERPASEAGRIHAASGTLLSYRRLKA